MNIKNDLNLHPDNYQRYRPKNFADLTVRMSPEKWCLEDKSLSLFEMFPFWGFVFKGVTSPLNKIDPFPTPASKTPSQKKKQIFEGAFSENN